MGDHAHRRPQAHSRRALRAQHRARRRAAGAGGARRGLARRLRRAALASALACPVAAFAGMTAGAWTLAALGLAVVLLTTTELWNSAAQWFIQTDVPPAGQRGAYVGMGRTVGSGARMVAP